MPEDHHSVQLNQCKYCAETRLEIIQTHISNLCSSAVCAIQQGKNISPRLHTEKVCGVGGKHTSCKMSQDYCMREIKPFCSSKKWCIKNSGTEE